MKWALVTGAGGGIGRAAALQLSADGYAVFATDRDEMSAKQTFDIIVSAGGSAKFAVLDVTNAVQRADILAEVPDLFVLVNSAGIYWTKPFKAITGDDFEKQFATNVTAMFDLSKAAAAAMLNGGRIINISSRAALGGRNNTHYSAAKAAILGMSKSMALELADDKITVNVVAPGVVLTDMLRRRGDDLQVLAEEQPLKRLGHPEDIAHAISYFADERASFVTGQVLFVDGGRSIGGSNPF